MGFFRNMLSIFFHDEEDDVLEESGSYQPSSKYSKPSGKRDVSQPPYLASSSGLARLEAMLDQKSESFSQCLLRMIRESGLPESVVYNKAAVDRRHFHKIKNTVNYVPTKNTVISFALALSLPLDETNELLKSAGFVLSDSLEADIIVKFFIQREMYDLYLINDTLYAYGLPTLTRISDD